ncbi:RIP metalloprotease RseP [Tahibacter harae]|uniref:Zinc metalloprotease n=1 Tax=Tahibacter harae TaxID=2963937 RepID=A0ABT1QVJ9_9GAMM|nr:RIP metalloprotease RseP [Tahibacter harae]MCQ4166313.1 RIP metalloprotease RseP [Tahibacter harae]
MSNFFSSIWWLAVTLGLLVTFHEFGHYWVARRFGVKVLRFSIGFGKPLWTRIGKDGTEYCIAAIPLGGYVKFLDSREYDVGPAERSGDFTAKPIWQRMLIVIAGPAFNLIFTIFALWAMFVVGKPDYQPLVGRADGIAATAGFAAGDRIDSIAGEPVSNWTDASLVLLGHALDRRDIAVAVTAADGSRHSRQLDLSRIDAGKDDMAALRAIGLVPKFALYGTPGVGEVAAGSPAEAAGIKVGDRVISLNGKPVADWDSLVSTVQAEAQPGTALKLSVLREDKPLELAVTPRQETNEQGKQVWRVGIGQRTGERAPYDALLRYGPLEAVPAALRETANLTGKTLAMLKRMLVGTASLQNLSGPVTIAQVANASAQEGSAHFFQFLALISLSLCIMNLLPIPILDGGHLVYYLIESIKGSPLSEKALIAGQYAGLVLLAALMGLAFYNDIVHRILS